MKICQPPRRRTLSKRLERKEKERLTLKFQEQFSIEESMEQGHRSKKFLLGGLLSGNVVNNGEREKERERERKRERKRKRREEEDLCN